MNFTPGHIEILEGNRSLWESLRTAGFIMNLDKTLFDQLHAVMNEAVDRRAFYSFHCGDCRAELVRVLYTQYDKYLAANPAEPEKKGKNGKVSGK